MTPLAGSQGGAYEYGAAKVAEQLCLGRGNSNGSKTFFGKNTVSEGNEEGVDPKLPKKMEAAGSSSITLGRGGRRRTAWVVYA
jgi:hypothetical protein